MNYQPLVSVCSHTGLVILLVASHPTHANAANDNDIASPETKVIVVKEQPQLMETIKIIKEQ